MKHDIVEKVQKKANNYWRNLNLDKDNQFVFVDDNLKIINKRNYIKDFTYSCEKIEDWEMGWCMKSLNEICVEYCKMLISNNKLT